ncbi:MAG: hypothetical protein Q9167_007854 [Letrouitia subvulpina]
MTSGIQEDTSQTMASQRVDLSPSDTPFAGPNLNGDIEYPPMGFGEYKPRMLLMGLKRSGKSSISNVVFRKMAPNETLFLEATTTIKKESMQSFMDFQIWDLPGQINYLDGSFDSDTIFGGVGSIIWVIDAQDRYTEAVGRLVDSLAILTASYPEIKYSVFVHKVDSLSEDQREDGVREIIERISDDLYDAGLENPPVSYYPTSIYDHTIFEALSKVIQGLIPQLPTYEALLNTIAASCRFQKVYIFDVMSKVYIASDTSPPDLPSYELCSDFISAIMDLTDMYGWDRDPDEETPRLTDIQSQTAESMVCFKNDHVVYLRELNAFLALIGVSQEPKFEQERALVDYNVQAFQDTIIKVLARR